MRADSGWETDILWIDRYIDNVIVEIMLFFLSFWAIMQNKM